MYCRNHRKIKEQKNKLHVYVAKVQTIDLHVGLSAEKQVTCIVGITEKQVTQESPKNKLHNVGITEK